MRVWILPTAREIETLHALKDRGFSITTIRTRRGNIRNIASNGLFIADLSRPALFAGVRMLWQRKKKE